MTADYSVLSAFPFVTPGKDSAALFNQTTPYAESLGDGLILKSIGSMDDVERVSAFNGLIHGSLVDDMSRILILHHPNTRPEHWLFVEDEKSREVVSALCLIPWLWRYEDVALKAGEMGIVGTLESYRHKGLIRALDRRFKTLLREEGCDLSQIQGIPYFYRKLGYEYALPLEGGWRVELYRIEELPEGSPRFDFRPATAEDIPVLMRLYDEAACDLSISAGRSWDEWHYLLEHNPTTETSIQYWLVLDESGQVVGYWGVAKFGFTDGLNVQETSRLSSAAARASLVRIKAIAVERGKPYVRLNILASTVLVQIARAMDAHDLGMYAWQILIPDPARFLRKLAPIFERRVAASPFAGITRTFRLNLYREAMEFRFEGGRLSAVEPVGFRLFDDGCDLSLPPNLLPQLALGWRSREELRYAYPDVSAWGENAAFTDVLFPKVQAFIYSIY